MKRRWALAAAAVAAAAVVPVLVVVTGGTASDAPLPKPAVVEHGKGSSPTRVALTPEAASRLGIRTAPVRAGAGTEVLIPYGAVLYDPSGAAWTYTSPRRFVFQRENVTVARVEGGSALLTRGPPVGTRVVTVGATEIWGVEYGGIGEG
jgi:hypothetical protein